MKQHGRWSAKVGYDVVKPVIDANRDAWGEHGYAFEHLDFSSNVGRIRDAELYILKADQWGQVQHVLRHFGNPRLLALGEAVKLSGDSRCPAEDRPGVAGCSSALEFRTCAGLSCSLSRAAFAAQHEKVCRVLSPGDQTNKRVESATGRCS